MTRRFHYRALTAGGAPIDGEIEAEDARAAQRLLRDRGLTPLDVTDGVVGAKSQARGRPLRGADRIALLRELQALLAGGIMAGEALSLISESRTDTAVGQAAAAMLARLRQGEGVSAALLAAVPGLPPSVQALAAAGEATGDLPGALEDAVAAMDAERAALEALRTALIYPAFLVVVGFLAVAFLAAVVVPNFAGMLAGRNADLPWISMAVISGGMALRDNGWFALLSLCLCVGGVIALGRGQAWRSWPVLARWQAAQDQAGWCATMALLLRHRIDLPAALAAARERIGAPAQRARLAQAEARLRAGSGLSAALAESAAWPADLVALIAVGERSGRLPILLQGAAERLALAQRERLARRLKLVEPIAILVLGAVIGTIVLAVLLAVTAIGTLPL
jgi:general secretion pathway protein F